MVLWLKFIDSTVFCLLPTTILCPVIQMSPPETKAQGDIFQKRSILSSVYSKYKLVLIGSAITMKLIQKDGYDD